MPQMGVNHALVCRQNPGRKRNTRTDCPTNGHRVSVGLAPPACYALQHRELYPTSFFLYLIKFLLFFFSAVPLAHSCQVSADIEMRPSSPPPPKKGKYMRFLLSNRKRKKSKLIHPTVSHNSRQPRIDIKNFHARLTSNPPAGVGRAETSPASTHPLAYL